MATQEEVTQVLQAVDALQPAVLLNKMNTTQAGMGAVIRFLSESDGPVTAGAISARLEISTARVAVLLKKMDVKGLVLRQTDPRDARVTDIQLSEKGRRIAKCLYADTYLQADAMIRALGMEKLLDFLQTAAQLQTLIHEPEIEL